MNTLIGNTFLLIAEYDTAYIPIEEIGEKFFNYSAAVSKRMAAKQGFPFPVFRNRSQKSQWLVSAEELAKWIDSQQEEAYSEWEALRKVRNASRESI
ncbi:MAG: pyocin activator PrtN family protein [Candidatus Thiodiazotropha lotti]|nr:pyocin activator PrtN family protein [Candidatus Thiodiazotropha lotti]